MVFKYFILISNDKTMNPTFFPGPNISTEFVCTSGSNCSCLWADIDTYHKMGSQIWSQSDASFHPCLVCSAGDVPPSGIVCTAWGGCSFYDGYVLGHYMMVQDGDGEAVVEQVLSMLSEYPSIRACAIGSMKSMWLRFLFSCQANRKALTWQMSRRKNNSCRHQMLLFHAHE